MRRNKALIGIKSPRLNYIYLFFIISLLLIISGYFYYKDEAKRIRYEKYLYLKTITDFKIDQILEWKKERMADAQHFSASPLYVAAIENWLKNKDKALGDEMTRRNLLIKELRGFESVFIADSDKSFYLATDTLHHLKDTFLNAYIDSVFITKKICFSDFYYIPVANHIHLAIVSPILNPQNKVVAALVFLIDPKTYFYPLVQDWPIPSKSSEIAIVQKKEDSIIYINALRHIKNSAFRLTFPLTKTKIPAVQAILGKEGLFDGVDYRNIEVLSDIRRIRGTNWYIVTKVDKSEIFSELYFRAAVIIIFVSILILLSIAGMGVLLVLIQRKKERAVLREVEQSAVRLNRAEFISRTGNWELHLDEDKIFGSSGAQKIYGLNGFSWPLEQIQSISLPEYRPKLDLALLSLIKNDEPYDIEYKIVRYGTNEIVDIHSVATYDRENRVIFGTIQDITQVKKQAELLSEKDLVFQSLLEFSPIYIFFKDHNIRAVHLSRNYENMLGMPLSEILGKTMDDLFPSELAKSMIEDDKKIINEGNLVQVDEELGGKYYTTIKFPINRDGMPPMLAGFTLDITDRKKAEKELIIALERAEKSDKLKDAFLQNMSHEIRTPLNAIVGFSELLNDEGLTPDKLQNYSSIIINSSNQLLSIVNDILTVARIQTGQETANYVQVNVNKICYSLQYIFNSKAVEKGLTLSVSLPLNNGRAEIFTDGTKLNQVLTNLINNSLKFTHKGYIEFGYTYKVDHLEFYVKDSGIGIKTDHQEYIFGRFAQADISISKKYGGTGLGLSICKAYIELLGGKIWVNSKQGEGSEFYFTLPYTPVIVEEIKKVEEIPVLTGQKTILIAEDEDYNFQLLNEILSDSRYTLLHARNGIEAVDICKKNPQIDIVLMDIKMPEMDGQTAMRIIKGFRPNLPVIAQTAYVLSDEKEQFMKSGFVDYITKPIKKEEILLKVNKY